jgi:hypothetical protein
MAALVPLCLLLSQQLVVTRFQHGFPGSTLPTTESAASSDQVPTWLPWFNFTFYRTEDDTALILNCCLLSRQLY